PPSKIMVICGEASIRALSPLTLIVMLLAAATSLGVPSAFWSWLGVCTVVEYTIVRSARAGRTAKAVKSSEQNTVFMTSYDYIGALDQSGCLSRRSHRLQ